MAEKYLTYRLPEPIARKFEEAIQLAIKLNLHEHHLKASTQAERNDAAERIFVDFVASNQTYLDELVRSSKIVAIKCEAMERDGYRCIKCKHSRVNHGGVECHHVIPRSYHGPELALIGGDHDIVANLVTLCHGCHEEITNPMHSAMHWRAQAPLLFRLIGESGFAMLMEAHDVDVTDTQAE